MAVKKTATAKRPTIDKQSVLKSGYGPLSAKGISTAVKSGKMSATQNPTSKNTSISYAKKTSTPSMKSSTPTNSATMAKKAIKTTTSTGQKIPNARSKSGTNRVKNLY